MSPVRAGTCLLALFLAANVLWGEDWPGFRGLRGGAASDNDLPTELTKDNILWKIKLPGAGTSSPITVGDKIIVTCNTGYGTAGKGQGKEDQKSLKLLVVCLDRKSGAEIWKKEIEPRLPETPFNGYMREHGYASSTPVSDGTNVYVFFGKTGVFAFNLHGEQLWQVDVGDGRHQWGSAASPILYKDLLVVNASIESSLLIALNKKTGKEVWRAVGVNSTCWSTPIIVTTKEGKDELVISAPGSIIGYNPDTGDQLWTCTGIVIKGAATASTPVARDGIVYVIGGSGVQPTASLAVKAGGRGDVNKSHVLWRSKAGAGNCSPLLMDDQLCFVDGSLTCLNIADGKVVSKTRLYDRSAEYASPISAGGKIYALTRNDGLFVLSVGDKVEKLGHLSFADDTSVFNSSPAVSEGRLYLRSNEYLYCIGKK